MVSEILTELANLNLYNFIFKGILKLQQCGGPGGWGCITGEFTHDFLFSLFLPHIILVLFLYLVFKDVGHVGLGALLGVGGYIFIIQMGWYPAFASLSLVWLAAAIIFGIYHFIVGKFIPPGNEENFYKAGKNLGKKLDDLTYSRRDLEEKKREMEKRKYKQWRDQEIKNLKSRYQDLVKDENKNNSDRTDEKQKIVELMKNLREGG